MGFYHELGTLLDLKKQLAYTRCARLQSVLPLLIFARLASKMIICARLRLAKIIWDFRSFVEVQSCNLSNDPTTVYSCLAKESANFTNLMSATSNFDWAQDQCRASFDMLGKLF